ncbi:DUF5994 family protein [Amycolatopsis sp. NPDC049159]|uniref:DUF5994 family protein n=1 Tax=Amycolatopsis sp. NPDC049159 TaxID=3157210 RepID=UPI0033E16990
MPSGPNTTPSASPATEARLRLTTAATGRFDGAWWPHARDLSAELPALLGAVTERLGRIDRVTYHLEEWPAPHRRLAFDEGVVRLEGFRSQAAGSLTVIGWNRKRLTLAVVPPETGPETAERVLADAASGRTPQPA